MSESLLKKEFKQADVQRARNLINKKFGDKTKIQSGYQKAFVKYKEGDIWEELGKTWTIKNGIKQNVTKLDSVKERIKMPLACPKCGKAMKHHLDKKMYKIHGFCFDCTIDYEANLRKAGLYEQYEKQMVSGNVEAFAQDLENWVLETLSSNISMVTEQGDLEEWQNTSKSFDNKIVDELNNYLKELRKHI